MNKVALITGAGSGIGRCCALALLREGYSVVLAGRRLAALKETTGLTKSTALDGRIHNIACGQIDIGNAATEMTKKMQTGVPQTDGSVATEPTMSADDVARAVVYMASLPLEANVLSMTIVATQMPFLGRG